MKLSGAQAIGDVTIGDDVDIEGDLALVVEGLGGRARVWLTREGIEAVHRRLGAILATAPSPRVPNAGDLAEVFRSEADDAILRAQWANNENAPAHKAIATALACVAGRLEGLR